jgi:rhodanese-related sulfurtransferase
LDIRECFEYEAENLGWTNLPMEQVFAFLKQEEVSKDQKLLLLCNSGKRASALGNLLETEQAFLEVYIVEDGMQGWNRWIESKP